MITVYGSRTANTRKVVHTLAALGTEHEFVAVDLAKGEHKLPEHLARHPFGKTPAIEVDGEPLFESGAICRYLAHGTELYPSDPFARAQVDQWMDFFSCHAGRWLSTVWFEKALSPMIGRPTNEANLEEALGFLNTQLAVVDDHLGTHEFLTGSFSIADTFALAYVETVDHSKLSLAAWPHITAWRARVEGKLP